MTRLKQDPPPNVSLIVAADAEKACRLAARTIVEKANQAVSSRNKFTVVLSGGSTPRKLYELLASPEYAGRLDWSKIEFFWSDERYVPTSDPASNFHMTQQAMLKKVMIPEERLHRVRTEEADPGRAAQLYEEEIRNVVPAGPDGLPQFDVILLGLGTNGHTASLFPHQPALHERERLVIAEFIPEVGMTRVTMSAPLINAARQILFFVLGEEKAAVVHEVVCGAFDPDRLPAQLIRPAHGKLTWMLDQEAAAELPPGVAERA